MIVEEILQMPLVDHHAHGVRLDELDVFRMGNILNESSSKSLGGAKAFEKPVGLNIRGLCAPVLELPRHVPIDDYVAQRNQLGATEASRRLINQCGMSGALLDTYARDSTELTTPEQFAHTFGTRAFEVLRIESIFENTVLRAGSSSDIFPLFSAELSELATKAVGLKSIVAYRTGFAIDTSDPDDGEVTVALERWLPAQAGKTRPRLDDPVLCRRVLWIAAEVARARRIPIQLHVGIGDDDVDMPSNDPGHFSGFLGDMQELGVAVTLLHCYPYVRTAQWLADIYDNVYYDIGFMLAFGSPEVDRVMRESMEIGPFHKILYSSDAFGLAELFYISATRFRHMLAGILQSWIDQEHCSRSDAIGIARGICFNNAERIYRLDPS